MGQVKTQVVALSSHSNRAGAPTMIELSSLEARTSLLPSTREVVRAMPLPAVPSSYVLVIVGDVGVLHSTTIRGPEKLGK